MKVLVNALPLRRGGGVTYLEHQLAALARVAPELEIHTLVSPWGEFRTLPGSTEVVRVNSVPMRFMYEQVRLPFRQTDVLYCPANFGPMRSHGPSILTLHNANYYRAGLALCETKASRPWWKVRANHAAIRASDAVIAISQSLADEVSATLPEVASKVHVVPSGAAEWPRDSSSFAGLPQRYVLTVTSSAPHKHLDDLVIGWSRSLDNLKEAVSLVIVGNVDEAQRVRLRSLAGRHAHALLNVGAIRERRHLKWIYEHALAMISMSALEAFPLTPGEAGSVGCPLVLSDIPAHREVTMGNATFIPPRDVDALSDVLRSETYAGTPGSRHWCWPVSWQDNALATAHVLKLIW